MGQHNINYRLKEQTFVSMIIGNRKKVISSPRENVYRNLLASRSDSIKHKMSFSFTGPFTFLTMLREVSSKNSTLTWVTPPREPVLPITLITLANVTGVFVSLNIVSKNPM